VRIVVFVSDSDAVSADAAGRLAQAGDWTYLPAYVASDPVEEPAEGDMRFAWSVGQHSSCWLKGAANGGFVAHNPKVVTHLPHMELSPDLSWDSDLLGGCDVFWLHSPEAFDAMISGTSASPSHRHFEECRAVIAYDFSAADLDAAVSLSLRLLLAQGEAGVISDAFMRPMLACGMLVANPVETSIKGASYDLTLGDEFYSGGKLRRLSDSDPFIPIEPYDYAIVSSQDVVNLPRDVCGRFGPKNHLFVQGVIQTNGPQIDPGFRGTLMCLLFNTSNAVVMLKKNEPYSTIEFHRTLGVASPYKGRNQGRGLLHYLPANTLQGGINQLKREIEGVRADARNLQTIVIAVVSLVLAVVAILIAIRPFG